MFENISRCVDHEVLNQADFLRDVKGLIMF